MRVRNKDQKGITLIALIITIIVMLILVTVTISMAINGQLFNYAKDATTKTNQAIANEGKLGNGKVSVNDGSYSVTDGEINAVVDHYSN